MSSILGFKEKRFGKLNIYFIKTDEVKIPVENSIFDVRVILISVFKVE